MQQRCKQLWPQVNTANLFELTDYAGYKHGFLQLFGFDRADIDCGADVATEATFDCIEL